MIAVIPLGRSRPATLSYVARALEAHTPVTEIWTVGERPEGITPDHHIDSANDLKPRHANVRRHLRAAISELTEPEFVWIADDVFPLQPWTPGVYVRKYSIAHHHRHYPTRGAYSKAMGASIDIIKGWGYDPEQVPCGSIHRPCLYESERMQRVVEAIDSKGDGEPKVVYAAGVTDPIPTNDPKIVGRATIRPGADCVSLVSQSWKSNAGRIVRETFTAPSRWE